MKWILIVFSFALTVTIIACGGDTQTDERTTDARDMGVEEREPDPRGIGEVTNVDLTDPLNEDMIRRGRQISDVKCASCHLYDTEERLVGPGYLNITNRRSPEWIMNMITNVDVMLDEDPVAQKMLEECLVRMPDQNVSLEEARELLEFMRYNDEKHAGERDGGVL